MNDYAKIVMQYRQYKDDALDLADRVAQTVPISKVFEDSELLEKWSGTMADGIIEMNLKDMIKAGLAYAKKRGKITPSAANEITASLTAMSEVFKREMENCGKIALLDLMVWMERSTIMGGNEEASMKLVLAGWASGTPPVFADYKGRIKSAINGYHNNCLQLIMLLAGAEQ